MRPIKKGTTDVSVIVRVIDSTDGTPETSVAYNTAGVDLWYRREGAAAVDITEATLAGVDSAHSDGGFIHINEGYCRLDLPDAACATGVNGVMVGGTFTGMIVIGTYLPLVDYDPYDSVRMGMTALPNAAADAAGGLPISDAGGLDLDAKIGALTYTVAGDLDCNVQSWKGAAAADMTGDAYARLGAPAGASVSADVAAVKAETAAIVEDTGTTLEGHLTDIKGAGWSDENLTTIDANVDAAIADTEDIQSRLPAALVSGRISADAVAISGSTAAADAVESNIGNLDVASSDLPLLTEMTAAFTEIKGATWASGTDTLEHIRDKLTDIETDTQDLQTQVGAAGAGLSAVPWNAAWDAEVQSEVEDALGNSSIGTLSMSIVSLLENNYQMTNNKMTVNESTGAVALRNIGDTATIATGEVVSSSGTTTRAELSWV